MQGCALPFYSTINNGVTAEKVGRLTRPGNVAKYSEKLGEWEERKDKLDVAISENSGIIEMTRNKGKTHRRLSDNGNRVITAAEYQKNNR